MRSRGAAKLYRIARARSLTAESRARTWPRATLVTRSMGARAKSIRQRVQICLEYVRIL